MKAEITRKCELLLISESETEDFALMKYQEYLESEGGNVSMSAFYANSGPGRITRKDTP